MRSKLAAIAVALASSTCCPSLFLSVQKGKPAPRMPMPEPKIAETPIPMPSHLRNRFLFTPADESAPNAKKVLDSEIDQYSGYADMPKERNELVRALGSLERLEDKYGVPRRPRLKLMENSEVEPRIFQGMLSCDDDRHCDEIKNIKISPYEPTAQDRLNAFNEIENGHGSLEADGANTDKAALLDIAIRTTLRATGADQIKEIKANALSAARSALNACKAKGIPEACKAEDIAVTKAAREVDAAEAAEAALDAWIAMGTAEAKAYRKALEALRVCQDKADKAVLEELDACYVEQAAADKAIGAVEAADLERAEKAVLDAWIVKEAKKGKEAKEAKEARETRDATEGSEADMACVKSEFKADQVVEIFVQGKSEASYRRVVESAPGHLQGSKGCMIKLSGGIPGRNDARITIQQIHQDGMPRLARTMLSFVQFSDVQLRDPDALLGNKLLSHRLDWLVQQSFEYNKDLVSGNMYIMEALVATINKEVHCSDSNSDRKDCGETSRIGYGNRANDHEGPAFVIHTGDAIDAGLVSELAMFHRLVDRLNVPFFDVLGNHDVLVFGNLMPTLEPRNDSECASVVSIGGAESKWLQRLPIGHKLCVNARVRCSKGDCEGMRSPELVVPGKGNEPITHANARAHFISGFVHDAVKVPMPSSYDWYPEVQPEGPKADSDVGKTSRPDVAEEVRRQEEEKEHRKWCTANIGARTRPWLHGFVHDPRSSSHLAYYAFPSQLAQIDDGAGDRNLISVVVDTEDLKEQEAGAKGRIQRAQMTWLSNVLDCARPKDLVIVFGHHAISGIQTDVKGEFERLLRAHKPNVIAYVYGHDHDHQICRDNRENQDEVCTQFWEIQTASLLEFPQEARRVKIKYAGKGMAFLEVVAFHENLATGDDELGRAVARARTAAQIDHCRTDRNVNCSDDERVYRIDGNDANARLWFKLP
jgi:3',5'-cyclic AMP phosphodiesterase CpdA